jgi:RNA polymerase sigma-70 factor (ECF subfamily)
LYRVAYRTALEARAKIARRHATEQQVKDMPDPQVEPDDGWRELLPLLDRELDRLPDKYRVPVVLCELEGKSRKEVAGSLHIPEGTLSSRLAHAKKLLARRLSRYGAALSAGSVAALLSRDAASGCVPASLVNSTARAAVLTAGVVSARVVALTERVMKAMLLSKLKLVSGLVLAVAVGVGAVGLTYRQAAAQPAPSTAPPRSARATADELEELRLEVAALRKGLEATRARVKALEEGQVHRATPLLGNAMAPETASSRVHVDLLPGETRPALSNLLGRNFDLNPLAQAEAALKKLRTNPSDKQAVDALERALKQLKGRAESRGKDQPPKLQP